MCEGNAQEPNEARRETRRADNNSGPAIARSALDRPPPVASPFHDGWRPRQLVSRTPQHLATLLARSPTFTENWSAPPIIWKNSFLIAPTVSGKLLIWNLSKLIGNTGPASDSETEQKGQDKNESAASVNETTASQYPPGISPFQVTVASSQHTVVDIVGEAQSSFTVESSSPGAGLSIRQMALAPMSFLGGEQDLLVAVMLCGIVAVVALDTAMDDIQTTVLHSWTTGRTGCESLTVTTDGVLVFGYKSGFIEGWKLGRSVSRAISPRKNPLRRAAPEDSKSLPEQQYRQELVWAAAFDDAPVVRSLQELRCKDKSTAEHSFLVTTLQHEEQTATASMIQVLNISAIAKAHGEATEPVDALKYSVLAEPGKEILNSFTLEPAQGLPRRCQWVPSSGTDCLSQVGGLHQCAAALADGSVLLLSVSNDEWSIAQPQDQLLLSFPVVGMGVLNEDTLACCLRGSTTYLVPMGVNSAERPISVMSYPHEIDSDTDYQRVEFFSAGNLRVPGKFTKEHINVLIYAWRGGIVDIYSSELLQEKEVETRLLLEELVENGTAELLHQHLLTSPPNLTGLWNQARDEVVKSPSKPVVASELLQDRFKNFRTLLLSAGDDENDETQVQDNTEMKNKATSTSGPNLTGSKVR